MLTNKFENSVQEKLEAIKRLYKGEMMNDVGRVLVGDWKKKWLDRKIFFESYGGCAKRKKNNEKVWLWKVNEFLYVWFIQLRQRYVYFRFYFIEKFVEFSKGIYFTESMTKEMLQNLSVKCLWWETGIKFSRKGGIKENIWTLY